MNTTLRFMLPGVVLITGFLLYQNLLWMVVFLWTTAGIACLIIMHQKKPLLALLGIIGLAVLFRLFVVEIFIIPSTSMEDSIIPGDILLVNKAVYGPRLPQKVSDIPWLNILTPSRNTFSEYGDRLGGFKQVARNDVIVFHPPGKEYFMVKRCMGLPGEKLRIKDRELFINDRPVSQLPEIKQLYKINVEKFVAVADSMNISYDLSYFDERMMFAETELSNQAVDKLRNTGKGDCLHPLFKNLNKTYLSGSFGWSADNFGSVLIPAKNLRIKLTDSLYLLYREIFDKYEHRAVLRSPTGFYNAAGQRLIYYTFKNNYYFVLGDNRTNSRDSRFWGFLPEMLIEGKAVCVLFSNNGKDIRWRRLFKKV